MRDGGRTSASPCETFSSQGQCGPHTWRCRPRPGPLGSPGPCPLSAHHTDPSPAAQSATRGRDGQRGPAARGVLGRRPCYLGRVEVPGRGVALVSPPTAPPMCSGAHFLRDFQFIENTNGNSFSYVVPRQPATHVSPWQMASLAVRARTLCGCTGAFSGRVRLVFCPLARTSGWPALTACPSRIRTHGSRDGPLQMGLPPPRPEQTASPVPRQFRAGSLGLSVPIGTR